MYFNENSHALLGGADADRDKIFRLLMSVANPDKMLSINLSGRTVDAEFGRIENTVAGAIALLEQLAATRECVETRVLHIDDASLFVGNRHDSVIKDYAWTKLESLLRRSRSIDVVVVLSVAASDFNDVAGIEHFDYKVMAGSPEKSALHSLPTVGSHYDPKMSVTWSQIPIGNGIGNNPVSIDFRSTPHAFVYGQVGSGMTAFSHVILHHCLNTGWEVYGIDTGAGELRAYKDRLTKVATDVTTGFDTLQEVRDIMVKRYARMEHGKLNYFEDLDESPILLMVDKVEEFLDKPDYARKETDPQQYECAGILRDIARLGRAAGIHLLITSSSQNWSQKVPVSVMSEMNCRIVIGRSDEDAVQGLIRDAEAIEALSEAARGQGYIETYGLGESFRSHYLNEDELT